MAEFDELESTKIMDYDEFVCVLLRSFGAPLVKVELTEEQIKDITKITVETYRQYEVHSKAAMVVDPSMVSDPATGYKLPYHVLGINDVYQNITGAAGINTLFTAENFMYSQGYYDFRNFDLVSWVVLQNWLEIKNQVLGQNIRFNYNKYTKVVTFTPSYIKGYLILDVTVMVPTSFLWNIPWIMRFAQNEASIRISRIRTKFGQTQMLGGGTLEALVGEQDYRTIREELIKELISGIESEPVGFFVG
jgi:hypothetical protein